ncbi:MAG TPA: CPBP family intramembrane glutamic endopeptidase, partial [Kofleriaceae bacterium]|nr:CPBP family intramembrane glutamic endopeptidase [Kofleriaceae bacterium]
ARLSRARMQAVPIERIRVDAPAREARELLLLALGCSAVAGAAAAAAARWPLPLYPGADFTADGWYVLGFMLGGCLLWLRWRSYRLADVLVRWRPRGWGWAGVLLALGAGTAVNAQHLAPLQELLADGVPAGSLALGVMLPLVAAAIPEELAFRALLQTRLEKTSGRLVAIGLSTVLFTLWHLPSRFLLSSGVEGSAGDPASILTGTALPVFVVGLVFAAIWDRWRSFAVLVALHFAIDLLPSLRHAAGGTF